MLIDIAVMDQILINNFKIYGHYGYSEQERFLGQHLAFDLKLNVDLKEAGQTDNLNQTVDYGAVCLYIAEYVERTECLLLETLAEGLCKHLFLAFQRIQEISLVIRKTAAPIKLSLDSVGISICRQRHV